MIKTTFEHNGKVIEIITEEVNGVYYTSSNFEHHCDVWKSTQRNQYRVHELKVKQIMIELELL